MSRVRFDETDRQVLSRLLANSDTIAKALEVLPTQVAMLRTDLAAAKANEQQLAEEVLRLRRALADSTAAASRLGEYNAELQRRIETLVEEANVSGGLRSTLDKLSGWVDTVSGSTAEKAKSYSVSVPLSPNNVTMASTVVLPKKRAPRTPAQKAARKATVPKPRKRT